MFKLALPFAFLMSFAGCLVEATDPPGTNPGNNGSDPDAAPAADPADAGPTADADPLAPDAEPTPAELLGGFGDCMRIADWDASNLGTLALVQTIAGETCESCHSAGTGGNYLNADSLLTFNTIKTYPYILKWVALDAQLQFTPSDRLVQKGVEGGGHPAFTMPAALAQGIIDFFNATNAHYIAGECPDPAL